jgi:VWFA-related protein
MPAYTARERPYLMQFITRLSCGIALAAAALSAQTPPVFTLVRTNVTASDARGQSVGDLTAADVQIADQGKGARVLYFRHVDGTNPLKTGPGEYSNRAAAALPHTAVILLDYFNNGLQDNLEETHRLGKSLQGMASGENTYLYLLAMDGTLKPIHALPGDGAFAAGEEKSWTGKITADLDKLIKKETKSRPTGLTDEIKTKKTYLAIETLAKLLAPLAGRRDIVYITNGFDQVTDDKHPCNGDWIECALFVPHLSFTLDRAGVMVDPISIGGLLSPDGNRDMEMLAGLTGGRAFFNIEPAEVLAQLTAMANDSYTIGFDITGDGWDQKFHRLKISTERKGVKLQARSRLFAYPDIRPPLERANATVGPLLNGTMDEAALGLTVKAAPAGKALRLQVRVEPQDLLVREEGGFYYAMATVLMARYGAAGRLGDPIAKDFQLKLDKDQYALLMKEGLTLTQDVPVDGAVKTIRVIAYDHLLAAGGAVTVPVPAL